MNLLQQLQDIADNLPQRKPRAPNSRDIARMRERVEKMDAVVAIVEELDEATARDVANALNCEISTAQRYLRDLAAEGRLSREVFKGRITSYIYRPGEED